MLRNVNINETYIRKRLFKTTLLTLIIAFSLIIFSYSTINIIRKINKETHVNSIHSLMNEYKINLDNQFKSDLEALSSLSYFLNANTGSINLDNFINAIKHHSANGYFVRMSYYSPDIVDNIPVMSSSKFAYNIHFNSLPNELQSIIKESYTGVEAISEVYYDKDLKDNIISYAIPIYDSNSNIIGVLSASRYLDAFYNILNAPTLFNYNLNIDWITKDGKFISWSKEILIKPQIDNIYDNAYISFDNKSIIEENISNNSYFESTLNYKGNTYDLYFSPLSFNNWYLVYLDKNNVFDTSISPLLNIINIITTLIILVILTLILIIYKYIKKSSSELMNLAYYDKLTGAYNFDKFSNLALNLLSLKKKNYSIVTLNIRHFQFINKIIGVEASNLILIKISDILKESISKDELYCRYNADQFYLFLHSIDKDELDKRISKIIHKIVDYVSNTDTNYPFALYSGVAMNDESISSDFDNLEVLKTLLYRGDFTQKHIDNEVENCVVFYDENMHKAKLLHKSIEMTMNSALENQEFKLFLQPKMNFKTNKIASAEALVRWIKDDGSIIFPDEFIPVFEQNGFCTKLDLYMVEKACQKIRSWIDSGKKPIPISVNQTKLLFYQNDYINTLKNLINKYNIPEKLIVLEFTESLATENIDDLNKTLSKLKELGFIISLDDFGSGYSSLNILSSLNIDEVKFDRVFLKNDSNNDKYKCTIINLVNLAKDLSLSTVMEGVETTDDETFLKEIGCDYGQGYLYSKPISSDEFDSKFM